jgi:adenylate cyclase
MQQNQARRLAAIFAADVVGWSRLVRTDEDETLARLKALRHELTDPAITRHGGRIVKLMGDGMLVEFASAVDAVRTANEVQEAMSRRNAETPEDRRIVFRVGINLGDVVVDGEDIHGDGVNLAARLEAAAPKGGVCVSDGVYEQVRDRLDLTFEDMGLLHLRNINRPVRAWRWIPGIAPRSATALTDETPELPEKPSIAVLSFDNMSSDPEQDFFADGIAEDIITSLSRIEWFFVVARNSSFTYKGCSVDVQQVGRELGVRYVLEGSVRSASQRLRVTAQLIDAHTGTHIWAEKYDREMADIFEAQDEITRNVVASTQTQIQLAEGAAAADLDRPSLPVWALINRAWSLMYEMEDASLARSVELSEQAVALDPGSGRANQMLASALFHRGWMGFSDDVAADFERGRKFAERAVKSSPRNEYARWVLGLLRLVAQEHDMALAELEKAIEINPNCSLAYGSLATVLNFAGQPDAAIPNNEIAIRANPRDPSIFYRYTGLAISYLLIGRPREAAAWARKAIHAKPEFLQAHAVLLAALAEQGDTEAADRALAQCLAHRPNASVATLEALPFRRSEHRERLTRGALAAGLPEDPS